ncbi:glycosyltransferase family 2 protein [Ornithinimicrobium pratense]|uniref:Glycosyltransferase family 2 protein n=1 Tax=Ornithinimicrobium pratense TaxID=2593973 RepID=A0A5J6V2W0_9MICO|nr:glycosyltransferase family A protein [Ornithinimicrobium pratense]QFG67491.1 glycosyltransferase family 2 protein [Ornithinimicrobium pratense]
MSTTSVVRTVGGALLAAGEAPLAEEALRLRALALRSRHDTVVDALARRAGSPVPSSALVARLATGVPVPATLITPDALPATLALATALVGMQRSEAELQAGVDLFEAVLTGHGPRALSSHDQRHLAQGAFLAGRHDLVEHALGVLPRLTDAVASGLRADLANPVVAGPGVRAHPEWEQLFGARFVARELAPPQVDPGQACLFDGLHLSPSRSVDGPLVSVVVPAYRPDEGLITSVRSILAQSYGHLEVLLVDDCSGPAYDELFARAESLDERVRLVRQERNGGSYLARNAALTQARGELVTTQDADDWSHPERIAAQVALMAHYPEAPASRSAAIRCRPDLTRQWFGYSPERMNASALMVRREALDQVGGYDQIRKGADSEMYERLKLLGEVVDVAEPLAVTRLAAGSLSRADFSFGRHSPDRVLFRSAFRDWHRRLAQDGDAHALAGHRDGQEPYPVPRSFVRDLPHAAPASEHLPVVLLADLADPVPVGMALEQLTAGSEDRLGVLGREDLSRAGVEGPSWDPLLLAAVREGRVEVLVDGDVVHADTLVALEPSLLALPALPLPALSVDRVLLAAVPPGPTEPVRDLEAAAATVRERWGVAPVWVARDAADQRAWAGEGWQLPLLATELRP